MARIILSVCGEGRGHATRALSIIEELGEEHEFLVLSFGTGFEYLHQVIQIKSLKISIQRIAGIKYLYSGSRLSALRTYLHWAKFIFLRLGNEVSKVEEQVRRFKPDLAIVDFEPCLPRAAKRYGIRCISIDHQHFIRFCRTDVYPLLLRIRALIGGWVCRLYVPQADKYLVTGFFQGELKRKLKSDVEFIGPVLRKSIVSMEPVDSGIIVSYLRKSITERTKRAFLACGFPVVIYGLGKMTPLGNMTFKGDCEEGFARDLAGASVVVAAAGNQLIGEALYYRKPFFAIPEQDHHEQMMNSIYLRSMGAGTFSTVETMTPTKLKKFLDERHHYANRSGLSGDTNHALERIRSTIEMMLSNRLTTEHRKSVE